jgi:chromatin assembly factor 1 subunit B
MVETKVAEVTAAVAEMATSDANNVTPLVAELDLAAAAAVASTEVVKKPVAERLFVDETRTPFLRRLTFTPDGSLLLATAGRYVTPEGREENAAYLFRATQPDVPVLRLGGMGSPVVCARSCPVLFERHHLQSQADGGGGAAAAPEDAASPIFTNLEHRMIFAVATAEAVLLYDTEQLSPFATVAHLHYAPITDMAWSADGKILAISSQDGYCSMVSFEAGELGAVSADKAPLMQAYTAPADEVAEVATAVAEEESTPQSPGCSPTAKLSSESADVAESEMAGDSPAAGTVPQVKRRINPTLISVDSSTISTTTAPAATGPGEKKESRRITPTLLTVTKASPTKHSAPDAVAADQPNPKERRITPQLIASAPPVVVKKRVAPILISTPTSAN